MPRARRTPEVAVLKAVKDYLSLRGVLVFRANSGVLSNPAGRPVRFGTPGLPDLMGVLPEHGRNRSHPAGRAAFVECKAGGNQPTERQATVMAELQRRGAAVCVARSIEDVREWLDELGV